MENCLSTEHQTMCNGFALSIWVCETLRVELVTLVFVICNSPPHRFPWTSSKVCSYLPYSLLTAVACFSFHKCIPGLQWVRTTSVSILESMDPNKTVSWRPSENWCMNLYLRTQSLTAFVFQWSEFLATDPEARVRFPALPHFLRSSGSGTGSTQPREYNWRDIWKKK
jgi:hypothetical protein